MIVPVSVHLAPSASMETGALPFPCSPLRRVVSASCQAFSVDIACVVHAPGVDDTAAAGVGVRAVVALRAYAGSAVAC